MHLKRKSKEPDDHQGVIPSAPKYYSCPEGSAHLGVESKHTPNHVLLDSGARSFLLSEKLVQLPDIPYRVRKKLIKIVALDDLSISSEGERYTCGIMLEIRNGHRSPIPAEIVPARHFDLIIRFVWVYQEHDILQLEEPKKWAFEQNTCRDHVADEAVKNLFEYEETVTYDSEGQYVSIIGIIEVKDPEELE